MVETASILPQEVHPSRSAVPPVQAEEEISFMDLLLPIFRNPRLFLVLLFAFSLPGVIFLIFAPRQYEASCLIQIGKVPIGMGLDSIGNSIEVETLVNSFQELNRAENKKVFPRIISIKNIGKDNLIRITAIGKDPLSAYSFLRQVTEREIIFPEKLRFQEKLNLLKKQISLTQKDLERAYELRTRYELALRKRKDGSPLDLLHVYQLSRLEEQIFSMEQTLTQLQNLSLSPRIYPTRLVVPIIFPSTPSFPNPFPILAVTFVIAFFLAYAGCFLRDLLRLKRKSLG
jgi:hypothetical protein